MATLVSPTLFRKNNISAKNFLTGSEEAEASNNGDDAKLHLSILRNVDIFASAAEMILFDKVLTGAIKTKIHGGEWLGLAQL